MAVDDATTASVGSNMKGKRKSFGFVPGPRVRNEMLGTDANGGLRMRPHETRRQRDVKGEAEDRIKRLALDSHHIYTRPR